MADHLLSARKLENELPRFWVSKIKTYFCWLDTDDDGYITEKDLEIWGEELAKLFPGISQEQKDMLVTKNSMWNEFFGVKGKGQVKYTWDMCIEKIFEIASEEGGEAVIRNEWDKIFTVMDVNKDDKVSKIEHRMFFYSHKLNDLVGATVSFTAIDEDMDGTITRKEFVNAAVEFFLNFGDETKRSKHFFGPLKFQN